MRDYKNVKVPRSYNARSPRTNVKRVQVSRGPRRETPGLLAALVKAMTIVLVVGGCFLGWMGYHWVAHSETFQVAGVDVTGAPHLSKDELANIAGVFTGQNVFSVSLDEAAQRARALAWVRDVRLYRRLPNRITMTVNERVPCAILDNGAGHYLVDTEGVVIAKQKPGEHEAQPLPIVMINGCRAQPGQHVESEGLSEARELLAEIEAKGGWNSADLAVRANSAESLAVVYNGHEFKIGSGNYAEKLRRLGEIMNDVQQRKLTIAYVDLRAERQAAVMVKDGGRGPGTRGSAQKKQQVRERKKH